VRKNIYCNRIGAFVSLATEGTFGIAEREFSTRAQVRYTSNSRSSVPSRKMEGSSLSSERPSRLNRRCLYTFDKVSILVIDLYSSTYLRFDEYQVNEKDDKVVFYVFVCKSFAVRTLGQSDAFPQ
jgi:hypothetical protein